MPGTMAHESPPSWLLNKDAGSTPHHSSFLPSPGSSDQMLTSVRPSSLGNAGAPLVSSKLFPRFVDRNTFMPKNGLQLDAYRRGVPRVSMSVAYTGMPGPNGPRSAKLPLAFAASATNTPFLVPMVRMTRSANSTSRDCRQDRDHVPRRQRRVDPVEVAHIVRVHEHVQVPAHHTRFVTNIAVQRGLAPLEILESGADG